MVTCCILYLYREKIKTRSFLYVFLLKRYLYNVFANNKIKIKHPYSIDDKHDLIILKRNWNVLI